MFDVITFGSATRDIFLHTQSDFNFKPGMKVDVSNLIVQTGGAATNVAVGLARLGLMTAALVKVGDDEAGENIISVLKQEEVNTSLVIRTKKNATALSVVLNDLNGERVIFTHRGASEKITRANVKIKNARCLYVSALSGGSLHILPSVLAVAKKERMIVVMNPGSEELGVLAKSKSLLKFVDALIVNKEEFERIMGKSLSSEKDFEHAFSQVEKLGVKVIAVTDGKNRVRVYHSGHEFVALPFKVKVVNMLGAGDAFAAGFVACLLKGKDLSQALNEGCLNAWNVVQNEGAKVGLLKKDEMNRYKKKLKVDVEVMHFGHQH